MTEEKEIVIDQEETETLKLVKKEILKKVKTETKPGRGGLMKRTLKELAKLDIALKDVFSIEGMSINLSWGKVINLVNYNAEKKVLGWNHTFEESLEVIDLFLL